MSVFKMRLPRAILAALAFAPAAVIAAPFSAPFGTKIVNYDDQGEDATWETIVVAGDTFNFTMTFTGGNDFSSSVGSLLVTINGQTVCTGANCNSAQWVAPSNMNATIKVSAIAKTGEVFPLEINCVSAPGADPNASCRATSYIAGPYTGSGGNTGGGNTGGGNTGGGNTGGGNTGGGTVQPTPAQQKAALRQATRQASQSAAAAAATSSGAVGSAISNAFASRGGSTGPRLTQNGLFFSTQGQTNGAVMWGALKGTKFSGALDGQGGEVSLGADWEVATDTILGVALSFGSYEVELNGTSYENEALAFGPYMSTKLADGIDLKAFVLLAKPEYKSGGASWDAHRVIGGVDLGVSYALGGVQATGYFALSGFKETLSGAAPGGEREISQTMASLGSRFDFAPTAAIRPNMTIGADAIRFDDGLTVMESTAPHFGLGLDADMGPGTLSINLDGSEIFDEAKAVSLGLRFSASF